VNEPKQDLYDWLHAQHHRDDVNNGGCGTDQNIWNQWPHIEEMHPRDETQRWSVNGYPGPERPAFWHLIAKPGQKAKDAPPDSGGWKNSHPRVLKLWKLYDGWKPLYQDRAAKERPFWIFTTGRNCEDYVEECIRSVQRQREHFQMVIVDDASTDNTYEIASGLAQADGRITVIRNKERLYGARSRYEAIMSMKARADDIVVQLDMDDVLMDGALTRIRLEYREQPDVWMTYGSLVDQTGKKYMAGSPEVLGGQRRRLDNMLCIAPRSFRAGLFWMVGQKRLMRGSQWLRCKFDLSATCAMQEMAGPRHMRAIQHVIYKALVNTPRQVYNTMREEERLSHDYVISQPMRKSIKAYARKKTEANRYLDGIRETL
jgi:glycosyltransferase involved in cell wall biosynthesis